MLVQETFRLRLDRLADSVVAEGTKLPFQTAVYCTPKKLQPTSYT